MKVNAWNTHRGVDPVSFQRPPFKHADYYYDGSVAINLKARNPAKPLDDQLSRAMI